MRVPAISGFTTPPLSVSAMVDAFVANPLNEASGLVLDSVLTAGMLTSAGSVSASFNGAVILTYEYTPFEAEGEDPVAVAEPEIVGLLAGGCCSSRRCVAVGLTPPGVEMVRSETTAEPL